MEYREAGYSQEELLEAVIAASSFGEALRIVRTYSKYGQREVGDAADVAQGTVVRWEKNKIAPTKEQFEAVCDLLRLVGCKAQIREALVQKLDRQQSLNALRGHHKEKIER